jgi:hypothetical protein
VNLHLINAWFLPFQILENADPEKRQQKKANRKSSSMAKAVAAFCARYAQSRPEILPE